MKILVVSDIHGSRDSANKLKEILKKEDPDKIVVLGDLYYQSLKMRNEKDYDPISVAELLNDNREKLIAIKGNCDDVEDETISNFTFKEYHIIEISGKKIFLTHGHIYNMDRLPKEEFDVLMYGHLHTGFLKVKNRKIFANPGSISLPKEGTKRSYIIIEDEKIVLNSVNGDVIDELEQFD